jgi:hypothetical protein
MIGFYLFNDANQLVHKFKRAKGDKKKHIDRVRKAYMTKGQSVICIDQTV